ncbi:spore protease YyaC [Thalassobacillus hwangdonensis]|uniref:Spore protease YyaC n=1 Tax=Thalassobacillus hwangdonensis TaxID=546108 RepID=A0ABW3L4B9_9BACI
MNLKGRFLQKESRYLYTSPAVIDQLSGQLLDRIPEGGEVVIACIGTDRSTGDAFGPLVGSMLNDLKLKNFHVYGTLADPLHALNLKEKVALIERKHARPFIIAIDACLGKSSSIGMISVQEGPLAPGAAMKKDLPKIGDISISGIVNVGGFMEYFVLQNTRLHTVIEMATKVADAIQVVDRTYGMKPIKKSFRNLSSS